MGVRPTLPSPAALYPWWSFCLEPDHLKRTVSDGYKPTDLRFPPHDGRDLLDFLVPCRPDCVCSLLFGWRFSSPYSINRTNLDFIGRSQYLDRIQSIQSNLLKMVTVDGDGRLRIYGYRVIAPHVARIQQSPCIQ